MKIESHPGGECKYGLCESLATIEERERADPINVGERYPEISGVCPQLTPDGRALIFLSQRTGTNNNVWVDARFLEELRGF